MSMEQGQSLSHNPSSSLICSVPWLSGFSVCVRVHMCALFMRELARAREGGRACVRQRSPRRRRKATGDRVSSIEQLDQWHRIKPPNHGAGPSSTQKAAATVTGHGHERPRRTHAHTPRPTACFSANGNAVLCVTASREVSPDFFQY